jgi:hypothetical protein
MGKYLIREFTEFDLQRFGGEHGGGMPNVHANNPNLSHGAFDRHEDNIRMSNVRLNDILNSIRSTNNIYSTKLDRSMDGLDISNLKIQRMFSLNDIDVDVYITFDLAGKNYFGVIKSFIINPRVESEVFKDGDLFVNKEWRIKLKGLLLKTIKNWLNVSPNTKWKALKPIQCTNSETGELLIIDEDSEIKVLRTLNNNTIVATHGDVPCEIKGLNFYYFNYWFESV